MIRFNRMQIKLNSFPHAFNYMYCENKLPFDPSLPANPLCPFMPGNPGIPVIVFF